MLFSSAVSVEEILLERREKGCNFTIKKFLAQRPGITEVQFLAPEISMNDKERQFLLKEIRLMEQVSSIRIGTLSCTLARAFREMPFLKQVTCEEIDPKAFDILPSGMQLVLKGTITDPQFPFEFSDRICSMCVDKDVLTEGNIVKIGGSNTLRAIKVIGETPHPFFEMLKTLPSLEKVSLIDNDISSEKGMQLTFLPHVDWSFAKCRFRDLSILKELPKVSHLNITKESYSLSLLQTIYSFPHIESLSIEFPKEVNEDPFPFLALLSNVKFLALVHLPKNFLHSLSLLQSLQQLRTLWLEGEVSSQDLFWMAKLCKLQHITISKGDFRGGTSFLVNNFQLRSLHFHSCFFGDATCRDIASCRNLRFLYLDGGQYSNKGVAHLSELTHLEHLCIANTYITSQGVQHIAGLQGLRLITLIGVQFTYRDLINILSNPRIRWFGSAEHYGWYREIIRHFYKHPSPEAIIRKNGVFSALCRGDSLLDGFCSDIEGFPIRKLYAVKKYLSKQDLREITQQFQSLFSEEKPPSAVRLRMYYCALLKKAMAYPECQELLDPPENPFLQA